MITDEKVLECIYKYDIIVGIDIIVDDGSRAYFTIQPIYKNTKIDESLYKSIVSDMLYRMNTFKDLKKAYKYIGESSDMIMVKTIFKDMTK